MKLLTLTVKTEDDSVFLGLFPVEELDQVETRELLVFQLVHIAIVCCRISYELVDTPFIVFPLNKAWFAA